MENGSKLLHLCYLSDAQSVHTQRWAKHFVNCGYRVTVISFRPCEISGCNVIWVKPKTKWEKLGYLLSFPKINRIISKLQPDILHAHYVTSYGFIGCLSGFHPFIVTAWGSDVLVSPNKSLLYRLLIRWVFNKADLVTTVADHMTEELINHNFVDQKKVITLPFGVDTDSFNPSLRTKSHDGPPYLVLSTRSLKPIYDVQTFVKASAVVLNYIKNVSFIVGSDGPLRNELTLLAEKLGVKNNLTFIGWIPFYDLLRFYSEADVVISTALSDGNNVTLNEAMACGAFPIATDIPANKQWIVSGENGFLFPPGDWESLAKMIILALNDEAMRNVAAEKNWKIVQQRASWQKYMKLMTEIYIKLVRNK